MKANLNLETAYFGGGCFWCTEAVFLQILGVVAVIPGYSGGKTKNPTYEMVSTGQTGHAEVVKIDYQPQVVKYTDLLTVFFATHDPTTLNQQGNDIGTQYRSVIFYTISAQQKEAEDYIRQFKNETGLKIVTQIEPFDRFYSAEAKHYRYFQRNQDLPYCQIVIEPKLTKLKTKLKALLKTWLKKSLKPKTSGGKS